jgi:hypothetical protein
MMRLGPRAQLGCGALSIIVAAFGLFMWFAGERQLMFKDASPFFNLLACLAALGTGCLLVWGYVDYRRRRKSLGNAVRLDEASRRKLEAMMARPPQQSEDTDASPDSSDDRGEGGSNG